jgi:RimJ/RimL family protein N-acetyltransferase
MNEKEIKVNLGIFALVPEDVDRLYEFYDSLPPETVRLFKPYGNKPSRDVLIKGPIKRIQEGKEYGLIVKNKNILGHAYLRLIADKQAGFGIGLSPSITSKGWGRALMERLINEGVSILKIEKINLIVVKENIKAISLYKKWGFFITKQYKNQSDGLDYYKMSWEGV